MPHAAKERDYDVGDRREGSFVRLFPHTSVRSFVRSCRTYPFPRVRQVLKANKRDLTNCSRSSRRGEVVHFDLENGRLARPDIEIDKFAADDDEEGRKSD